MNEKMEKIKNIMANIDIKLLKECFDANNIYEKYDDENYVGIFAMENKQKNLFFDIFIVSFEEYSVFAVNFYDDKIYKNSKFDDYLNIIKIEFTDINDLHKILKDNKEKIKELIRATKNFADKIIVLQEDRE